MSSAHALRQPRPLFQQSTSSSLIGMETPLPKPKTRLQNSHGPINLVAQNLEEKPLPPTPRNTSSVYSVQYDKMQNVREQSSSDALLLPQTAFQSTTYRASTSRVLDANSKRPKLVQNAHAHAISDPILEMRQLQQQDIEKIDPHWSKPPMQRMKSDFPAPSESINKRLVAPNKGKMDAEKHASTYESLLHTRSPALPTLTPEPYSDYDYLPSAMSSRITDVVDRSLLPTPLSYNTLEKQNFPSSAFSSSSSEADGFPNGIRGSLRAYARKALRLPRPSLERASRTKASSKATSEKRRTSALVDEPVAGPRRGSIQQGISHMYDTLAKFSITSQQPNPKPATRATKTRVPRELRSPAIPVTPYQQLGKKAWQSPRSSKKSHSPSSKSGRTSRISNPQSEQASYFSNLPGERTNYFSNLPREDNSMRKPTPSIAATPGSMRKKIASAFHTGTTQVENAIGLSKASSRLAKSERRREELKKKIVVIYGDQNEGEFDNH